jgi:hypothetical protein
MVTLLAQVYFALCVLVCDGCTNSSFVICRSGVRRDP